mmetsp:Transcript_55906/g.111081  ORF Transcript_55906/g.111081 Transcript_55906/m.111081 type:complete len:107 (-) Transcript_55906:1836-2156(-)
MVRKVLKATCLQLVFKLSSADPASTDQLSEPTVRVRHARQHMHDQMPMQTVTASTTPYSDTLKMRSWLPGTADATAIVRQVLMSKAARKHAKQAFCVCLSRWNISS